MKTLPINSETEALARRLVWFETPPDALSDTVCVLSSSCASSTHADMKLLRAFLSEDDLRETFDAASAGIIDPRSWAYWNPKLGRYPAPPIPPRRFS